MKEYPLHELVLIKKKRVEEAEKNLQEKKELLFTEQQKLVKLEEDKKRNDHHRQEKLDQFRATLDAGTTSDKIEQMKHYLKVVDEKCRLANRRVDEQKKVIVEREKEVEEARQLLLKKQKEVEKLQIHRKEWEKEMRYLEVQEEGRFTDEMGSTIHHINKQKNKPPYSEEGL